MLTPLLMLVVLGVGVAIGRFFPYKDIANHIQNDAVKKVLKHFTDQSSWVCVEKPCADAVVLERNKGWERMFVWVAKPGMIRTHESVKLSLNTKTPYSDLTSGRWQFPELFSVKGFGNSVPQPRRVVGHLVANTSGGHGGSAN